MCGIAGIFGRSGKVPVTVMLGELAHRGPDDEFCVGEDDFALGARRLSIIDLEGGRQPIWNETEDIWAAQNGEIYNHPVLMEELKSAGHQFRTRSDTEVLVHLYEEKGEAFVYHLKGMYAVALWDGKKKKGFLVRDRTGKKPLYYHFSDSGVLYFASELKALLTLPFLGRRIHWPALHHYLSYKHIPAPLTIFEGIYMLPAAHYLIFTQESHGAGQISLERYWRLDFGHPWTQGRSEDEIAEVLSNQLRESVQRRLISDVPVGFFLSGGVDSALCVALGATLSDKPINTFTLSYGSESTSPAKEQDRDFAAQVARRYGTRHFEEMIEYKNLEEELFNIIHHFDEPFAGVISSYFLARLISRHVKVAISGDGADELFGSYLSHRLALPMESYIQNGRSMGFSPEAGHLDTRDRKILEQIAESQDWLWRYKLMVFADEEKSALYSPDMKDRLEGSSSLEHLKLYFNGLTAKDPLNRMLEAEFYSQLPDQVLTYVDRLSMAHSLEVRAPFLDTDFLELAAGVEGCWKIREGKNKYILKKVALRYLPEELVHRPKEGFLMPINQWLLKKMEPYVKSLLSPEALQRQGVFNSEYVQNLLKRFYKGQSHLGTKLWVLIAFQIWYEAYVERPR